MTRGEITIDEAMRRYYLDASFHYKVHQVVNILGAEHALSGEEHDLAKLAASIALMIAEQSGDNA